MLVAYAKLALKKDLLPSALPDDPWFQQTLTEYFPTAIREKYAGRSWPATRCAARSSPTRWSTRWSTAAASPSPSGPRRRPAPTPEQVDPRVRRVPRGVRPASASSPRSRRWTTSCRPQTQTALYLEFRRLLDRSVRWFLRTGPTTLDVAAEVERFSDGGRRAAGRRCPSLLQGAERKRLERRAKELEKAWRAPAEIAARAATLLDLFSLLDVVEISVETGRASAEVAPVYFATSEQFRIDTMLSRVTRLPRDDRWDALARGALRDDLYAVLRVPHPVGAGQHRAGAAPEDAPRRPGPRPTPTSLERAQDRALRRSSGWTTPGIAALSVALRDLRRSHPHRVGHRLTLAHPDCGSSRSSDWAVASAPSRATLGSVPTLNDVLRCRHDSGRRRCRVAAPARRGLAAAVATCPSRTWCCGCLRPRAGGEPSAHVRPTTGPMVFFDDVVGRRVDPGRAPAAGPGRSRELRIVRRARARVA